MVKIPKTVAEGAKLLDKVMHGWEKKINTATLDDTFYD